MAAPLNILLVDDAEVDRMFIREVLLRIGANFQVHEASTLQAAKQQLVERPLDCAIVDYLLPDGKGLDFLRMVKETQPNLPVIALTGQGSETVAVDFMKAGAVDYLPKAEITPGRMEQSIRYAVRLTQVQREARQAVEKLRESEERFRLMADTAPIMIWLLNADRVCTYINKYWTEFTGRTLEQQLAVGWTEILHPDDVGSMDEFKRSFDSRQVSSRELRVRRRDGEYRWILDTGAPRFTSAGEFAGFIGCGVDITERKATEQALRDARDQLEMRVGERTVELSRTNEELYAEMQERISAEEQAARLQAQLAHVGRLSTMGEMASGLAHELNQPLWAILNYVQGGVRMVDAGSADTAKLRQALSSAAAQAERAGRIIQRMREFVSKGVSHQVVTDAEGLVRGVADLLAIEIRTTKVKLEIATAKGLPQVFVDPIQIQQVILNLMRNAIEAMAEMPASRRKLRVRTTAASEEGRVEIAVSDTGEGCPPDILQQVFDPFFTTKKSGMGMGLAISKTIIENQHGQLTASPNDDGGMTFRFTVPASRS
jgi:PAS domain S-box-containing protein